MSNSLHPTRHPRGRGDPVGGTREERKRIAKNGGHSWSFLIVPQLECPLDPRVRGDDEWDGIFVHCEKLTVTFWHMRFA